MKVKMKFDAASIKSWLFEHGEKLAFGAMVLVFLMFAYSAMQREVLDPSKQQDQPGAGAGQVTEHVTKCAWDVKHAGVQIVDYRERAQAATRCSPEAFATSKPFSWPLMPPKGKRDDPAILAVEEPRAAAGAGIFAFKGATAAAVSGRGTVGPAEFQGCDARKSTGGVRPNQDSKLTLSALGRPDGISTDREASG